MRASKRHLVGLRVRTPPRKVIVVSSNGQKRKAPLPPQTVTMGKHSRLVTAEWNSNTNNNPNNKKTQRGRGRGRGRRAKNKKSCYKKMAYDKNARAAVAAKYRRDKEAVELRQLANLLPFPTETAGKLDKGAVLRLTISYLRMKQYLQRDGSALLNELKEQNGSSQQMMGYNSLPLDEGSMMLEALNGFVIFLDKKGIVNYVSTNVSKHLGVRQEQMLGSSIIPFLHAEDVSELMRQMLPKPPPATNKCMRACKEWTIDPEDTDDISLDKIREDRIFYLRMKCHITRKKNKQTGFLLMMWSGRVKLLPSSEKPGKYNLVGMVAVCRPMQSSPIMEIRLDGKMFMSRHDLGMRFTFCDPRILTLVGYEPNELIGKTAYQFHNPVDAQKIQSCHTNLIVKGTSVSKYYRFLGKNGEYIWMQTRATIIYNTTNNPQYVVCMNYVIGEEEGRQYLMLEQEDKGLSLDSSQGGQSLDTVPKSPGTTGSEGYGSGEEDPNFHSPLTNGNHTSPTSPTGVSQLSGSDSQPDTPISLSSFENNDENMIGMENIDGPLENIDFNDLLNSEPSIMSQDPNGVFNGLGDIGLNGTSGLKEDDPMEIDPPIVGKSRILNQLLNISSCEGSQQNQQPQMVNGSLSHLGLNNGITTSQSLMAPNNGLQSANNLVTTQQQLFASSGNCFTANCVPISSGANPTFLQNPGVGVPVATTAPQQPATISIQALPSQDYFGLPQNGVSQQDFSLKFVQKLVEDQAGDNMASLGMNSVLQPLLTVTNQVNQCQQTTTFVQPQQQQQQPHHQHQQQQQQRKQPLLISPQLSPNSYPSSLSSPHSSTSTGSLSPQQQLSPKPKLPTSPQAPTFVAPCTQAQLTHTVNVDHSYTSKAPRKSILQEMLVRTGGFDPQKGSDCIMAPEKDFRQLSLNSDKSQSYLKGLLTESLDSREIQRDEQRVINQRRISSQSPQQSVVEPDPEPEPEPEPEPPLDINCDPLDLLSGVPPTDFDNFWPPNSTEPEALILREELQKLLREQQRQDDAWFEHYYGSLDGS